MKKLFGLIVAGSLLSVACTPPSEEKKKTNEIAGYKSISCAYTLDDGSASYVLPTGENMTQMNFGKLIDTNRLWPLMDLSLRSTVHFIQESGKNSTHKSEVSLYYVDSYNKFDFCTPLKDILSTPPYDQESKWQTLAGDKSELLGLYLEKGREETPSTGSKASILLAEYTTRWTVIHEFMHHLFHSEVEKQAAEGKTFSDLEMRRMLLSNRLEDISEQFQKAESSEESERLAYELTSEFRKVLIARAEQERRYTLEEMTIEKLLIEKFQNHEFKNIHSLEVVSGASYIVSSYKKFKDSTAKLDGATKGLYEAFKNTYPNAAEILSDIQDVYTKLDAEAKPIAEWAEAQIPREYQVAQNTLNGVIALEGMPMVKPCAHSHEKLPEIDISFIKKIK